MITKDTALQLHYSQELHYGTCNRTVGPRGGIKESIIRVRVSGQCKTWKTRPEEFRVPVKHGLYESAEINHRNASQFHLPSECPALSENEKKFFTREEKDGAL